MAVEIPVYIDIDKAFADAAKRVPGASANLRKAIDDLNKDLELFRGKLNSYSVGTKNFELAAKNVMKLEEALDLVNEKVNEFTTRTGSVKRLSGDLRAIQQQFERMGESQMFDSSGKLSADAKKLQADYARVAQHLDRVRAILTEEYDTQVKSRQESEKAAKLAQERYEAINGYTNTIASLNARLAALRAEIANVNAYTNPDTFKKYAEAIEFTVQRISRLNEQQKILGTKSGSIDQMSAKLQSLSAEYSSLTEDQRKYGDRAKEIKKEYIEITKELEKESGALQKAARLEIEREASARKKSNALKAENAILATAQNTMRGLQEQERILSERLSRATFGSNKYKQLKADLDGVRASMQAMNGGLITQSTLLRNVTTMASTYVSLFGVLRLAKQIRDVTGELEYQRVALGHLIQDEEYGAKLFEQIKAAAIESPFRIKDLVTYTKQLAAYRIEQENLFDTTDRLADISAGLGVDMNRLILAFGQVRAASVLRGQELRQFTEAGIPLVELLAEKMGELNKTTYTTADVFKLISERAVPFSAISEIFEDLTEKGGMFYEMQERQAETLKGKWEKLKDALDIGLQAAGETKTFEWQNKLALDILRVLADNINLVPKTIEAVGYAWATYSVFAKIANRRNKDIVKSNYEVLTSEQLKQAGVSKTAISLFGEERASRMLMKANAALAASNGFLAKTFARLRLAMLQNPYAAIAGAVVGLVSLFAFWNKRTKETTSEFEALDKSIENISNATKRFNRAEKLIERYKDLASKTERTTEENDKLQATMSNLISMFPELADAINLENNSLEHNVSLLTQRNEKLLEQSRDKAGESLRLARQDLKNYNKEVSDAGKAWAKAEANAAGLLDAGKYEDLYESQRKLYDKLRAEADEWAKKRDEAITRRNNTAKRIETLERYLVNPSTTLFDTAWQDTIARLKDVKVGEKTINIVSESDIRGYESIYKALKKIDKAYIDSSNSLKEMRASLSSVSEEYRKQAMDEIAVEQARRNGYKKILDTFGYISSQDRKKGVSELTLLKEELRTVQDIYKRYQEFVKYLGKSGAREKIEKIYGGVTAIDFLDPEAFKKRLSTILEELKKLQGRVTAGAKSITKEYFDDLKETIKKNEGFRESAYKLAGESYYTIGYGFYKNLPDGRKVTKDMKLTREEADKLLDLGIEKRIAYVNKQIQEYGDGIVLNEKQMNVLVDLAYQSAHGVERVLKAAGGDINKLQEALKSAASDYLISDDEAIKAGVKKRDMRRAEAFAKAMADEIEDGDAIVQAIGEAEKLVQDVDWDEYKKAIDDNLKRVKDEIKRSETARSFYQDILGLTGDEQLAASMSISVYGSVGQDFKDRIKKELVDSLSSLDANAFAGLDDKIREAFDTGDYKYLTKNIEKVPEALRSTVQQVAADAEKFSADQVRTWIKELAKFKTYGEKRVQLAKQTAQEIEKINASDRPKDQKDSLILEYQRKEAEEAAKLQYEAFKDTPMYIHLFENLDAASTKMLTNMRDNLIRLKENWKDLDPAQLREMQKRIEEIDSQLAAKNPFKAIAEGAREYRKQTEGTSRAEIEQNAVADQVYANEQKQILETLTAQYEAKKNSADATEKEKDAAKKAMEDQAVIADKAQETANASAQTARNLEGSLKNIIQGADNIDKWTSAFSSLGSSVKNLMSEVLSDEDAEAFAEQFDGVMGAIDGLSKAGGGIAKILKLDFTGIVDIVSGVVDSIAAIFGASNAANVRRANKAIEQQQKIIDNLERSYQRLEDAMDEAFGTDYLYNYRKELEIINAEVAAYRAQAAAERSKGKKADEDKALEYERSAEEAMERIKETTKEMQSFFAGSDLTSLAADFSSAWLDAYREFGNTAGAIEERMEEMVKNLVEKAALSGIVQNVLGDWYESLKSIKDWNAQTIAEKVAEARALIPVINQGLNAAASELQAAGTSLRGTVGQFTGISRDYAAASEESINGLAAGVNTQNFFLQHLDMNVSAILSVLTGGASTAGASVTGEAVDPYKDQMLLYASNLPQMRDDLAAIRIALDRVIKPSGNKYAVQVQM